jgi:hypothetical protein
MKIRSVGVGLFRADRWTGGRKDRHDEPNIRSNLKAVIPLCY